MGITAIEARCSWQCLSPAGSFSAAIAVPLVVGGVPEQNGVVSSWPALDPVAFDWQSGAAISSVACDHFQRGRFGCPVTLVLACPATVPPGMARPLRTF